MQECVTKPEGVTELAEDATGGSSPSEQTTDNPVDTSDNLITFKAGILIKDEETAEDKVKREGEEDESDDGDNSDSSSGTDSGLDHR